tara:strand:- start:1545 stop:2369 length:825 start_codon:yes stop_codon:yes gene_type:complete
MRLFILTFLALLAFAANSILNRWALLDGATGPMTFAFVRVLSGAIFLWLIVAVNDHKWRPKFKIFPSISLSIYIICFSIAYLNLGIGIGAVVLFGAVQFTMFGLAALTSEEITLWRILGAIISFSGVCVLFLPTETFEIKINEMLIMILAAAGWGVYSFLGKNAKEPLLETTQNLIWAIPFVSIFFFISPDGIGVKGLILAILSGAITSGLGYVVWYSILPFLKTSFAAILQLFVPLMAAIAGVLFFSEEMTVELVFATILVILGTFVSLIKRQ